MKNLLWQCYITFDGHVLFDCDTDCTENFRHIVINQSDHKKKKDIQVEGKESWKSKLVIHPIH